MTDQAISQTIGKITSFNFKNNKINIVLAILILIGIFFWIRLINGGIEVNPDYPWGIFIVLFLLFESITSGALFFASVGVIRKSDPPERTKLLLTIGLISAVCAGLSIIPDLGSPSVFWRLLFVPNFSSPVMLDLWFLGINIIIGLLLFRAVSAKKDSLEKAMSWLQSIVSIILPLGTAWLFISLKGRPGWNSSLELAVFLVEAVLAGVGVVYLTQAKDKRSMIKVIFLSLIIGKLALILGEIGYSAYSSGRIESLPSALLSHGYYAVVFWIQVFVCFIFPLYLIAKDKLENLAAWLILAGIALGKYLFVLKGNSIPYLNWTQGVKTPGLSLEVGGYQHLPFYIPGLGEWLIVIGIIACGVLAINLIAPRLGKNN